MAEEIEIFVRYAVAEESYGEAMQVVARYSDDIPALLLLREFYRSLPEVREEPVEKIVELASQQGVKLLAVITHGFEYLYALDGERVVFISENGPDLDEEHLAIFGYPAQEDFHQACNSLRELTDYSSAVTLGKEKCPVCFTLEGEYHQLGCPVEVCPWCMGQLNHCNCRFDQLGVEQILDDEELARFQRLLIAKGRIRYSSDQAPAYPGMSAGLDQGEP
ncbi:hypothetical protein HNQ81_002707 [Desulfoprunum benzoelyticum]|uniref:Uncharacterized protein n=1 Tax=Desulfoprunum benzoelyticum TaxID=1506996 RepID=A0A840UVV4_9BACT|nr:hypothetical protein [Desulfoprunum benzoelyticum]MBB5348966.1 hypothetical protein [Desulfoprunum benzoelyticum]